MKSSIKVDFRSRYSGTIGDKEALIRVEVEPSEDPRDSLLADIFNRDQPRLSIFKSFDAHNGSGTTFLICKKGRPEQTYDIGSQVFEVMIETMKHPEGVLFVTGSDEMYLECGEDATFKRSKGLKRNEIEHLADKEIRKRFVQDFLEFTDNV